MTDILLQNQDRFWAQIDLDQLDKLPLEKWERICKKFLTLDVNTRAALRLRSWFPAAIQQAEEAVEATIEDEERLWTDTAGLRYGALRDANQANRDLRRRTGAARTKLKKLKARYDVFKEKTNFMED